jgi:alkylated DNA repair dioxygenase AlkB
MSYDLFNPIPDNYNKEETSVGSLAEVSNISGLTYMPGFVTSQEERDLLGVINNSIWLTDLKRRVQHYGYKYDYKRRSLDYSMFIGEMPDWTKIIIDKIVGQKIMIERPDQLIVNEYLPGQGIADHIDCEPCFEDTIISLSLGSTCIMEFKNKHDKKQKREFLLEPRSLVVMTGESRYEWTHGIPSREKDKWLGKLIHRKTRISLTFRKVIVEDNKSV